MPQLKNKTILPSAAEEQEIARQSIADDTVLTAEMTKEMKPISQFPELNNAAAWPRPLIVSRS